MTKDRTLAEELRDDITKLADHLPVGRKMIFEILGKAERLVRIEQEWATSDDWRVVGGNRIAIFKPDGTVIRIAEFFTMFDMMTLPADANAALAVQAVKLLRDEPPVWGNQ